MERNSMNQLNMDGNKNICEDPTYSLVEFDDGVQPVPSIWLFNDGNKCHYPNGDPSKCIKKYISPQAGWKQLRCSELSRHRTLLSARKKAELVSEGESSTTQCGQLSGRGYRRKKKKVLFEENETEESESENSSPMDESDNDENNLANTNLNDIKISSSSPINTNINSPNTSSISNHSAAKVNSQGFTTPPPQLALVPDELHVSSVISPTLTAFESAVIEKLADIQAKLNNATRPAEPFSHLAC